MKRSTMKVAGDAVVYATAFVMAYWLRFDGRPPDFEFLQMSVWLPIVVAIRLCCNAAFGIYRRVWRYVSIMDCIALAASTSGMAAIFVILRMFLTPKDQIFRIALGVSAMDFVLAVGGACALRIATRIYYEYHEGRHVMVSREQADARVILVGAGTAGIMAATEIRSTSRLRWNVIGFVDDGSQRPGTVIHGLPVLGATTDLPRLVRENNVDKVILTIDRASAKEIRRIIEICDAIPVRTQIIPGLFELLEGKENISQVRDVRIDDLLGREVVRVTESATEMSLSFRNKVILVSGAGGSIGGEICRQLAMLSPRMLVMIDKDENSLFETMLELRQRFPFANAKPMIGDLRNRERLAAIFENLCPEVVFHAAAHKHVPFMEENLTEAIENNVFGTLNLLHCSEDSSVGRFVMLSSDKAVNCVNVIGATKRIAELYIQQSAQLSRVKYACVRFGNVIGSRGSVVPIFQKQILARSPITITHPEATRYFMTIPEASQLVIQAATLGEKGEIFILDMGKPIRILDLARDMIRLSGLKEQDVEVRFIGLRPGEKLHEELIHANEQTRQTKFDKILVADPIPIDFERFDANLQDLRHRLYSGDEKTLRKCLFSTVDAAQLREAAH